MFSLANVHIQVSTECLPLSEAFISCCSSGKTLILRLIVS
jgi:hypothetical protein